MKIGTGNIFSPKNTACGVVEKVTRLSCLAVANRSETKIHKEHLSSAKIREILHFVQNDICGILLQI